MFKKQYELNITKSKKHIIEFTDEQIKKFKDEFSEIIIGVDHEMYKHSVKLSERAKKALALDFD